MFDSGYSFGIASRGGPGGVTVLPPTKSIATFVNARFVIGYVTALNT